MFMRHYRLAFSEIIGYKADVNLKWLAITGLLPEVWPKNSDSFEWYNLMVFRHGALLGLLPANNGAIIASLWCVSIDSNPGNPGNTKFCWFFRKCPQSSLFSFFFSVDLPIFDFIRGCTYMINNKWYLGILLADIFASMLIPCYIAKC